MYVITLSGGQTDKGLRPLILCRMYPALCPRATHGRECMRKIWKSTICQVSAVFSMVPLLIRTKFIRHMPWNTSIFTS